MTTSALSIFEYKQQKQYPGFLNFKLKTCG